MPPVVAVITPTKNRLKLLLKAVDSVQQQTFRDWEHIIVDDGSTDGTGEFVLGLAKTDSRVRYIPRPGGEGANVCRNLGLRSSRGELVVFLDSDDLLAPECLEGRVQAMRRNLDVDFVTFQTAVFVKSVGDLKRQLDSELLGDDLLRFLFFECPWTITGPIWRRSSVERLGGFDEALPSWQDVELHIRALTAGCRYLRYPVVDHHVRWQFETTKVSVEQRRSPAHLERAVSTIQKIERLVQDGPGLNWVRQRALCSLYLFVAENTVEAVGLRKAISTWHLIRKRRLGPSMLYLGGALLLCIQGLKVPSAERLSNKWKGWARLRTNPELVG
jgi:glycosyltransferase involved in cell wall biosynthesis